MISGVAAGKQEAYQTTCSVHTSGYPVLDDILRPSCGSWQYTQHSAIS